MSDSVLIRIDREREKTLAKYGEKALEPGGNPSYDILDYAINEVIGMNRYGEMIINRAKTHSEWNFQLQHELYTLGRELQAFAFNAGERLIAVRNRLLEDGHMLGEPEKR